MPHQEKATCWNVPHPENDHILENVTSWRMSHPGLYKSWGQTNLGYSHPFEEKKIYPKDIQKWKTYEHAAGGKPDNQNKLFADWDIPNVLNLTPPCMLVFLLVPTVVAWLVTVCLQGSFIYYIAQEVSSLKWPEGEAEAGVCFVALEGDMGSLKMTKKN